MSSSPFAHALGIILLFGPYVWECIDDKDGDLNKRQDLYIRAAAMITVSVFNGVLNFKNIFIGIASSFLLSWGIHFMLFDYTIAFILIKRQVVELKNIHWFSYLGKLGAWDNWSPWRNLTQRNRLLIRLGFLIITAGLYLIAYLTWKN